MALPNDIDLLNPPPELEKRKRTRKPTYTLMCQGYYDAGVFHHDVKCQGCFNITTVSSHSQTVVVCGICQTVLCPPTGGRARLTESGCFLRRKAD